MNRKVNLAFSALIMVLMITAIPGQADLIPMNLAVDDSFTFEVLQASESSLINGVEYAADGGLAEGDKIDVTVTEINNEAEDGYVMVTETVGDDTYEDMESTIDNWPSYFQTGGFISIFTYVLFAINPEGVSFDAPGDPDPFVKEFAYFDYFASSNESVYDDFDEYVEDLDDGDDVESQSYLDKDEQTYEFTYLWEVDYDTTTTGGDPANFTGTYDFEINVDLSRSVITYFKMVVTSEIIVDTQRRTDSINMEFEESGGGILGFFEDLGVPAPSPLISLLAMFALIPILRRRK